MGSVRLSDAEWRVMNEVWSRSPASARDVLEGVAEETGWAYSTVKTVLARLVEKGALSSRLRANTTLYEPVVTREQARRSALSSLLESAFGGRASSLVQHLLDEERLSGRDRSELTQLLQGEAATGSERGGASDDA